MLALAVALAGLLLCFYNFYYKRKGLPPGPTPLPIIGNAIAVSRCPPDEDIFLQWRKEFGPIYTYWLGELPVVCVTEHSRMVELLQQDGDTYAGRWDFRDFNEVALDPRPGVIWTEGEVWREHRRFAIRVLRDFGLGKNVMQERVLTEVETLITKIRRDIAEGRGDEVDVERHIEITVGSIINSLLFGFRFDEDEAKFYHLKEKFGVLVEFAFSPSPAFTLLMLKPRLLAGLPYFRTLLTRYITAREEFYAFFWDSIHEELRELEKSGELDKSCTPTNYVHAYLQEKAELDARREDGGGGAHLYTLDQLRGMCTDMWQAGQETSTTTLTWGLVNLIENPQHQARLQEELDSVIGSDRLVTLADRPLLPFTCACIDEIQRLANVFPTNVLRRVTRDVEVDGYRLPAGTAVLPQISAILHDPTIYSHPRSFNPSRHLDSEGKLQRCAALIPFSMGKRQCMGESLARVELFLFLANMFNQFRFKASSKRPMPAFKQDLCFAKPGITSCPHFVCRVESRWTTTTTKS